MFELSFYSPKYCTCGTTRFGILNEQDKIMIFRLTLHIPPIASSEEAVSFGNICTALKSHVDMDARLPRLQHS